MRKLLVLISWCLLGVSCMTGRNATHTAEPRPGEAHLGVFSDGNPEAVFHGGINVYKHHFSGIFALKQETSEQYRMVLMSEVGMSLLDMSFTPLGYQINYSIEPLRKKALCNLLYQDFLRLSMAPPTGSLKPVKKHSEKEQFISYRKEKSKDFYFFEKGTMVRILSKGFMNRTDITFAETKSEMADSIHIIHWPVKLEMALKRIN